MRLWVYGMVGLWDCGPMGWRAHGIVGSWDDSSVGPWDRGPTVLWNHGIVGL